MEKQIAIIADKLTLPIDEGLKKLTFKMMQYGLKQDYIDVYNSPEQVGLDGITVYSANKLMKSLEIKSLLNSKHYSDIFYIPEASTTFNTFVRACFISHQAPNGARVHIISSQKRYLNGWQKFALKFLGNPLVITFSKSAQKYIESLGLETSNYSLAADDEVFKPVSQEQKLLLREKYGVPQDARIALHVGHVKKCRNIGALKNLALNGWQVIVVGSTSMAYEEDVAKELMDCGIMIRGEFNPHVEELYQLSDIYVFPVRNEDEAIDFPLSVVEAMACGLPVVSTPFGALPDNFKETKSFGYFLEDEQLPAIAERLYGVDASLNRQIIREKFSWDKVFEQILLRV